MFKRGDEAIVIDRSDEMAHFFPDGTRVLILDNGYTVEDGSKTYYNCKDVNSNLEQNVSSKDLKPVGDEND